MPGRFITYIAKYLNLSAVSPVLYSAQNTEVNQIYQDLNDIDAGAALKGGEASQNFLTNNLAISGLLTLSGQPVVKPGDMDGSLEWVSASSRPMVKVGTREFRGVNHFLAADYTLLSSDAALACNQTLDTFLWYTPLMNSAGAFFYCPAFDISAPPVTGRSIAAGGVVVTGTTFVINMAVTTGMTVGNIIVIKNSNGVSRTCDGAFKIVSVSAGVSVTVTGKAVGNATYLGGTVDSFFTLYSLHVAVGGVSATSLSTGIYSPSPPHCPALNIYGYDKYLIPTAVEADIVYRGIGQFYNGATSTSVGDVISYKSGNNKNDNYIEASINFVAVTWGSAANMIPQFLDLNRARGNDTIYLANSTIGHSVTLQRSGMVDSNLSWFSDTQGQRMGITVDSGSLSTRITLLNEKKCYTSMHLGNSISRSDPFLKKGTVLRAHLDGASDIPQTIFSVRLTK